MALPWAELPAQDRPRDVMNADPKRRVYRIPNTAFVWKTSGAFGYFKYDSIAVNGGALDVAMLDGLTSAKPPVLAWLKQAGDAVSDFYGRFPVRRALTVVVPQTQREHSFGMAVRGGGIVTVILLPAAISEAELDRDWTPVHELLHLGVPRMAQEDAWFFEGLATYYTEVVRARARMQTAREAWQELVWGFARGRRSGTGLTLQAESAAMQETRAYHRVYWVGAAIALMVDVELRKRQGPLLENALRAFANCCSETEDDWTSAQAIAYCDRALGSDVFASISARYRNSSEFPRLEPLLSALGVRVDAQNNVTLDNTAELSQLRRNILREL
jgi:hypothetical protein